jgi:hypothetical protein
LRALPRHLRPIRHYGFLSHNQRGQKLPLIRRLLGLPEPEREVLNGEPLLPEEEDEHEKKNAEILRPCPVCKTGVLIEISWPRPTIAQIMQMTMEELRQSRLPSCLPADRSSDARNDA